MSEPDTKTTTHQFVKFRRQIEHTGKNGKMAPAYRILILQKIKLEKNGFHSLKEQRSSISYHIKLLSKN